MNESPKRKKMNNRLTAAAPELLEALTRLVNLSGHPLFTRQRELAAWEPSITAARTIIDKALGDPEER